jgi:hypothetical protein
MATQTGRNASAYWGTSQIQETRNIVVDLGTDFIEDTVHGDTNRTFAPTFSNFSASITGLYSDHTTDGSKTIINDALAATSRTFSLYMGANNKYFRGSGYVSVDNISAPYDDFDAFDWSLRALGAVTWYSV